MSEIPNLDYETPDPAARDPYRRMLSGWLKGLAIFHLVIAVALFLLNEKDFDTWLTLGIITFIAVYLRACAWGVARKSRVAAFLALVMALIHAGLYAYEVITYDRSSWIVGAFFPIVLWISIVIVGVGWAPVIVLSINCLRGKNRVRLLSASTS